MKKKLKNGISEKESGGVSCRIFAGIGGIAKEAVLHYELLTEVESYTKLESVRLKIIKKYYI